MPRATFDFPRDTAARKEITPKKHTHTGIHRRTGTCRKSRPPASGSRKQRLLAADAHSPGFAHTHCLASLLFHRRKHAFLFFFVGAGKVFCGQILEIRYAAERIASSIDSDSRLSPNSFEEMQQSSGSKTKARRICEKRHVSRCLFVFVLDKSSVQTRTNTARRGCHASTEPGRRLVIVFVDSIHQRQHVCGSAHYSQRGVPEGVAGLATSRLVRAFGRSSSSSRSHFSSSARCP